MVIPCNVCNKVFEARKHKHHHHQYHYYYHYLYHHHHHNHVHQQHRQRSCRNHYHVCSKSFSENCLEIFQNVEEQVIRLQSKL